MRILGMHASFGSFSRHPPLRVLHAPHGTRVPSRKTQGNLSHCNKKQFCGFERGSFVLVHDRARDSPLPPPPPPTRTGRTTDAVVPAVTNKSCSCGARPPWSLSKLRAADGGRARRFCCPRAGQPLVLPCFVVFPSRLCDLDPCGCGVLL